jgi:hypothetical protein
MYIFSDLYQSGVTVYGYGYTQIAYPEDWAHCPANEDDCWDYYPSYTSLYLTKDGGWQASEEDQEYDSYSEVWATADADAGNWELEVTHTLSPDWEDWYYQLWFTTRSDSLSEPEYAYMTIYAASGCGDQRDAIIQEYVSWQVDLSPQCSWFNNGTAHSTHFTNSNMRPGETYYSWSLIKQPLTVAASSGYGLDRWVDIYMAQHTQAPARAIVSGYRSPNHNAQVSDYKKTSRHMHGDAIDLANATHTYQEYIDLRNAAMDAGTNAGASYVEPWTGKCGSECVHADWRNRDVDVYSQ